MEVRDWDKRYRLKEHPASDFEAGPTPLLVETAAALAPGRALDLACGAGRNALWLAEKGWEVTAVDGAPTAIEILRGRAAERGLQIDAVVADLEKDEFEIEPSRWDFVAICYYLQRNLFEPAKRGVAPGGVLISIVHMNEPGRSRMARSAFVPASSKNISPAGKFCISAKEKPSILPIGAPSPKSSRAGRCDSKPQFRDDGLFRYARINDAPSVAQHHFLRSRSIPFCDRVSLRRRKEFAPRSIHGAFPASLPQRIRNRLPHNLRGGFAADVGRAGIRAW